MFKLIARIKIKLKLFIALTRLKSILHNYSNKIIFKSVFNSIFRYFIQTVFSVKIEIFPNRIFRKFLSLLTASNYFHVSVFSTHITHRGTGRRFRLSSLRHINHSRGGLRASCALVSRGSRYISLQVKCNQSVHRRTCAHAGHT